MPDKKIGNRAVAAAVLFQGKQMQSQQPKEDEMVAHCRPTFEPLPMKCTFAQWEQATPEQKKDYNERLEQAQRGGWLSDLDRDNQRDDEFTDNSRGWPES